MRIAAAKHSSISKIIEEARRYGAAHNCRDIMAAGAAARRLMRRWRRSQWRRLKRIFTCAIKFEPAQP